MSNDQFQIPARADMRISLRTHERAEMPPGWRAPHTRVQAMLNIFHQRKWMLGIRRRNSNAAIEGLQRYVDLMVVQGMFSPPVSRWRRWTRPFRRLKAA